MRSPAGLKPMWKKSIDLTQLFVYTITQRKDDALWLQIYLLMRGF